MVDCVYHVKVLQKTQKYFFIDQERKKSIETKTSALAEVEPKLHGLVIN
jgi:hypothetical protein